MAKFQGIKIRENAMVYILEIISLADFRHLGLLCVGAFQIAPQGQGFNSVFIVSNFYVLVPEVLFGQKSPKAAILVDTYTCSSKNVSVVSKHIHWQYAVT